MQYRDNKMEIKKRIYETWKTEWEVPIHTSKRHSRKKFVETFTEIIEEKYCYNSHVVWLFYVENLKLSTQKLLALVKVYNIDVKSIYIFLEICIIFTFSM